MIFTMKKLGLLFITLLIFLTSSAFNLDSVTQNETVVDNVNLIESASCAEAAAGFLNDYEAISGGCLNAHDYNAMFTMVKMYCEIMM